MEIASETNQLLSAPQADSRVVELRVWMIRNGETYPKIGKALPKPITGSAVEQLLKAERISVDRHGEFKKYGIPESLLPPAQDVPKGRPPKQ